MNTTPQNFCQTLIQEHRKLLAQINNLQRFWSEVDELGQGPKFVEMGSRVQQLRVLLTAHFSDEEHGGYLAIALEVAPHFTQQASQLKQQHEQFLLTLDQLISKLQNCDPPFDCWQNAGQQFEAFLAELRKHEHAENAIVQSSFNDDVGIGD